MHIYSELLFGYLLKINGLAKSGKIKDDFRITFWGKYLRKFYLDEIPQLYNLIKGDISILGPRAVSKSFFDTYPENLKKIRVLHKPGFIPPYVSLNFKPSLKNVFLSEKIYFKAINSSNSIKVKFLYFIYAFYNVLFKKIKSE